MTDILYSLWLIFPVYVANAAPVLFKGTRPIDFNRSWRHKPIFGPGKTWEGIIGGTCVGMLIGLGMNEYHSTYDSGFTSYVILFSLTLGGLLGDLFKSFLKRRLNKERGEKWLIADQIDFLAGALVLCFVLNPSWFETNFTYDKIIFLFIFTPLVHLVTNIFAYAFKLKKVPW